MFNQFYPPQMRQTGFVRVRSRAEAESYPIAPGSSVTFVDETAPLVYVKTLGPSQFDRPTMETYKLERIEEPARAPEKPAEAFALQSDVIALQQRVDALAALLTKREEAANE